MSMSTEIHIKNASVDPFSSICLDELIDVVKRKFEFSNSDVYIEHTSIANAKCDLTLGVTIVTSIATGVISAAIWDCIKSIYAKHNRPKDKREWKLDIDIDRPLHVSVKEDDESGNISIEINEME